MSQEHLINLASISIERQFNTDGPSFLLKTESNYPTQC